MTRNAVRFWEKSPFLNPAALPLPNPHRKSTQGAMGEPSLGTLARGSHGKARGHRALAYLCRNEYAEAIEDYSKAVDLRGLDRLWELYRRATPLWITGRRKEAAADYSEFRMLRGRTTRADARLFLVLCENGEPDKAERVLEGALRDVKNEPWLRMVFECLAGARSPDQLVDAADHEDVEQIREAYYYAGESCWLTGQMEKARGWFQKCVDTGLVFDGDEFPPDPKPEYHLAHWRLVQLSGRDDSNFQDAGL